MAMATEDEVHHIVDVLSSKLAELNLLMCLEKESSTKVQELKRELESLQNEKDIAILKHRQALDLLRRTEFDCKRQLLQAECQAKQIEADIKASNLALSNSIQVKANREREFAVVNQELEQARAGYEREHQLRIQRLEKFKRRLRQFEHHLNSTSQILETCIKQEEEISSKWTTANVKHEILTKELENRVARSMELEMQVGNLKRMASELEASVQSDRAIMATARATHEEQVAELCKVLAATSSEFALKAEALLETRESQLQLRLELHEKIKLQTKILNEHIEAERDKEKEFADISNELKAARALREQLVEADKKHLEASENESAACEHEFGLQLVEFDLRETDFRNELLQMKEAAVAKQQDPTGDAENLELASSP